ncbi:unnamed protein product [Amoebophrya sp. A25]|nr:unnamed protein product [Amoebophrya sp. A25]|eukprot:GSA25T00011977001.1
MGRAQPSGASTSKGFENYASEVEVDTGSASGAGTTTFTRNTLRTMLKMHIQQMELVPGNTVRQFVGASTRGCVSHAFRDHEGLHDKDKYHQMLLQRRLVVMGGSRRTTFFN